MREMENKTIGQIRFEFTDGTWFILDHQSLKHLKDETKLEVDFALSKVYDELEASRAKSEEHQSGLDLGINTYDDIRTKDVGPGQAG